MGILDRERCYEADANAATMNPLEIP